MTSKATTPTGDWRYWIQVEISDLREVCLACTAPGRAASLAELPVRHPTLEAGDLHQQLEIRVGGCGVQPDEVCSDLHDVGRQRIFP